RLLEPASLYRGNSVRRGAPQPVQKGTIHATSESDARDQCGAAADPHGPGAGTLRQQRPRGFRLGFIGGRACACSWWAAALLAGFVPSIAETWPDSLIPGAMGLGFMWLLAACAVDIVLVWQRQPLAALGLRPLSWQGVAIGIGVGMVAAASLPLLAGVAQRVFPDDGGGTVASITANAPAWFMLLVVLTSASTEEVLWRAVTIGQLQ